MKRAQDGCGPWARGNGGVVCVWWPQMRRGTCRFCRVCVNKATAFSLQKHNTKSITI
jgi:hypothetical protein